MIAGPFVFIGGADNGALFDLDRGDVWILKVLIGGGDDLAHFLIDAIDHHAPAGDGASK
jgi:hypothetical protein